MATLLPALLGLAGCGDGDPAASEALGSLRVLVRGSGEPGDPDGVRVAVGGAGARTVSVGGEALFEGLAEGEHEVEVAGVAPACSAEQGRVRTVVVEAGRAAAVTVAILCGDEQTLVFASTLGSGSTTDLYTIRPDGTSEIRLTSTRDDNESSPTWSPDRTRLAFARGRGLSVSLWIRELDGTGETVVVPAPPGSEAGDLQPAWSPDGDRIAFTADGGIWIVRPDGSGLEMIQDDATDPAWSPDGTRIAFLRWAEGVSDLMVADADGTGVVQLTDTPGQYERGPTWSPDGSRIAFVRRAPELGEIRTVRPDGSDGRLLRRARVSGGGLSWSPAGGWIAGVMTLESGSGLAVVRADGGAVRLVRAGEPVIAGPAW